MDTPTQTCVHEFMCLMIEQNRLRDDTYIFDAARSHLKGSAKNWFLSHQAELIT